MKQDPSSYREDDALWKLLGQGSSRTVSQDFTNRVLAAVQEDSAQELPRQPKTRPLVFLWAAAAIMAAIVLTFLLRPSPEDNIAENELATDPFLAVALSADPANELSSTTNSTETVAPQWEAEYANLAAVNDVLAWESGPATVDDALTLLYY